MSAVTTPVSVPPEGLPPDECSAEALRPARLPADLVELFTVEISGREPAIRTSLQAAEWHAEEHGEVLPVDHEPGILYEIRALEGSADGIDAVRVGVIRETTPAEIEAAGCMGGSCDEHSYCAKHLAISLGEVA